LYKMLPNCLVTTVKKTKPRVNDLLPRITEKSVNFDNSFCNQWGEISKQCDLVAYKWVLVQIS
jgi:hypothetical protein